MSELLHLSHSFQVRAMAQEERSIEVIASTEAIDSYGEIVAQDWDLRRYLANPVVLWGHNSYGLPIGSASDVRVETDANGKSQLLAKLKFVDAKANPQAELVWQGIVQGSIRAVSVGFRTKHVSVKPVGTDKEVIVLSGNELVEISVVPIPANPEALSLGKKTYDTIKALAMRGAPTKENPPMSIVTLAAIAAAMCLPSDSTESSIIDHAKKLDAEKQSAAKSLKSIYEATGTDSVDGALGVIAAGKDALAKAGEQTKKLEDMERSQLIAQAKADKKLTPHQEKSLEGKPLDFVKSFIELQVPNPALKNDATEERSTHSVESKWNGKTYSELTFDERHKLANENPTLWKTMREASAS